VSALDDLKPHGVRDYEFDGTYIPRIMFAHSDGHVMRDIINEGGNPQFRCAHNSCSSVLLAPSESISFCSVP
jgi:hypothetical protein